MAGSQDPASQSVESRRATMVTAANMLKVVHNLPSDLLLFHVYDEVNSKSLKDMLWELDEKVDVPTLSTDLAGGVDQMQGIKLGLLLGILASLPGAEKDFHIHGLPGGTSVEAGELGLEVLFAAMQSPSNKFQSLTLVGHEAFGTEKACTHLGQLLRSPHCKLESLTWYKVGMREDGVKHIAQALRHNTCLRNLKLAYCPLGDAGVEHLASVLRKNATLQNLTLRNNGMTGDGARHLCNALSLASSPGSGLCALEVVWNSIGREGGRQVGNMLAKNCSLEQLVLTFCGMEGDEGHLAEGLRNNGTLKLLDISDNKLSKRGLGMLFRCLANHTTLEELRLRHVREMSSPEELAAMIASNQSLKHLNISAAVYTPSEWATVILPGVAESQTMQGINLSKCPGVSGEGVLDALFKLVRTNTSLKELNLDFTPLRNSGDAEALFQDLKLNALFRFALSLVPKSKPKSRRIVLIGKEYAGKTTLLKTMKRLQEKPSTYYQQMKLAGQQFWQRGLRFLPGNFAHNKELSKRTRGIDIHLLKDEGDLRVSVWDFAGHREFHVLHYFMFPSVNSAATLYVFTFSPVVGPLEDRAGEIKTHHQLGEEFFYWLKFISSNCKRPRSHGARPSVVVVITNKDVLTRKLQGNVGRWLHAAEDAISMLVEQFQDLIDVRREPYVVNGLAVKDGQVKGLLTDIEISFGSRLDDLPDEPTICDKVAKALGDLQACAIISTAEFLNLCESQARGRAEFAFLDSGETGWRAIAAYLHNAGEVIYHEKLNFIVRSPRWFGQHLINIFSESSVPLHRVFFKCFSTQEVELQRDYLPRNGLISKTSLEKLLKEALRSVPGLDLHSGVKVDELIQLMLLLDLCYEQKRGDPNTAYLLPAIFEDEMNKAANGRRPLKWRNWRLPAGAKFIFLARRLECADPYTTFLTDGFFPRLQVVLQNHAFNEKWVTNNNSDTYRLEKNLFSILVNGMEILMEYSGFSGYFVDILVKSSKSYHETMEFVHPNIIGTIRTFCASIKRCQDTIAQIVGYMASLLQQTSTNPHPPHSHVGLVDEFEGVGYFKSMDTDYGISPGMEHYNANMVNELRQQAGAWSFRRGGESWIEHEQEVHSFVIADFTHPQQKQLYALLRRLRVGWHLASAPGGVSCTDRQRSR